MAQIFVAMPFEKSLDPVLNLINDAAKILNAQTERVDGSSISGSIVSHIRAEIEKSDIMVAVLSEENGNVYYEVGLAHCQKKPVVILTSDVGTLKFDLRDHRAIVYDPNHPDKVRDELIRTIMTALHVSKPSEFIESVFGSTSGLRRVLQTISQEAGLHEPVKVTQKILNKDRTLSIEIVDYFDAKVRAVIDVNGIITTWKLVSEQ